MVKKRLKARSYSPVRRYFLTALLQLHPFPIALYTLIFAYGGGLWMHLLHEAEGAEEISAPSSLLHWLRDATLMLPLVLVAVIIAFMTVLKVALRLNLPHPTSQIQIKVVQTYILALIVSLAMAFGEPFHTWLFNAHHTHSVGAELSFPIHLLRDGIVALLGNLAISSAVTLFRWGFSSLKNSLAKWQGVSKSLPKTAIKRVVFNSFVVALMILSMVFNATEQSQTATAATDPGSPCPVGAPLKHFDIQAIDVDIPLNRFGDHDPFGKMYVLSQNVQAVMNQLAKPFQDRVSIGLNGFPMKDASGNLIKDANGRVRMQEDAIQSLVIRANANDCVEINFTNNATPTKNDNGGNADDGIYGIHIDGLAYQVGSSGDGVGSNPQTGVAKGASITYKYYIPNDPALEGARYMHPGPSNRAAVEHGLFGTLTVEPPESLYFRPDDSTTPVSQANPQTDSGWARTILPGPTAAATGWCNGFACPAFRENVKVMHDIGDENYPIKNVNNGNLPTRDPHTDAYRPGSRGFNYRSEPFMDRLDFNPDQKSQTYGSYTFGDPATIIPRGYIGDPTKFRIMHAGSEVFHVYHLHGGAIRWRFNPRADQTWDYGKTGLDKHPQIERSESWQLDAQNIGPGESYNLEIEGGAGSNQQVAGEFLFHCHIAHHYFSGMWGFWRVFDTLQPDLAPLPDRVALPLAVDSSTLIGKTFNGMTIATQADLDAWIRPQLPPQGVKAKTTNSVGNSSFSQDGSVMDWQIDTSTGKPIYLNEVEDTSNWVDNARVLLGHPGSLIVDRFLAGANSNRPVILFNPTNGRPAFPMLRPHIGSRPPFAPNGHSGAPYLGEKATPVTSGVINPYAGRNDSICPAGVADPKAGDVVSSSAPQIRYNNIVALPVPIPHTANAAQALAAGLADPNIDTNGAIFVLAQNKASMLDPANATKREPIALRANIGDCIFNTLVSEEKDGNPELPYAKTNIHIHHVQFDTQASDGVISGFSFEQSVRPFQIEDSQLTNPNGATVGDTVLSLSLVTKFKKGIAFAIGEGTNDIEINRVVDITVTDPVTGAGTVTLANPLSRSHAAGQWAGVEFVQYIWYPDIALDNIFFHDHVNGVYGWSHGMVGQLVIEPRGATYHDPKTGVEIASGAQADIHCLPVKGCNTGLMPGYVNGSFREQVLWTIDNHGTIGAPLPAENSLNLHSVPWPDRLKVNSDPSLLFSSYTHGDPYTPLPRAYKGDQLVIRTVNVSQNVNVLAIEGVRFSTEARYSDTTNESGAYGKNTAAQLNALHYGISERYTLILDDGSGTPGLNKVGDFLYHDGNGKAFRNGAWGDIRVLDGSVPDLQPLPENIPGSNATVFTPTGGRPPVINDPGNPCPAGVPTHSFAISAVKVPKGLLGGTQAFVATVDAPAVQAGSKLPEPLVLHVAQGECVKVNLTNDARSGLNRVSFDLPKLASDPKSSGVNIGFGPEQTVASGQSRTYVYYADSWKLGTTPIASFGGNLGTLDALTADQGRSGLYGALVVAEAGAKFSDPLTGVTKDIGAQVDVRFSDDTKPGYRDFTLAMAEQDPIIGTSLMTGGYPNNALRAGTLVNYQNVSQRNDDSKMFSSLTYGDPTTPILKAYAGDPMKVHVIGAPGSEQEHTISLGGHSFLQDQTMLKGAKLQTRAVGPYEALDAVVASMGGPSRMVGDFVYQDRRLPFTQAGMWGLLRSIDPNGQTCVLKPLKGTTIGACPDTSTLPTPTPAPGSTPTPTPTPVPIVATTCNVPIVALPSGFGYYLVINPKAAGQIQANWTLPFAQSASLSISLGNPYSGLPNPANSGTKSPFAQDSGNKSVFSLATNSVTAGQYTLYFFEGDKGLASTATSATITYVTNQCGQ